MDELIKIEQRDGIETVNARDLWERLESKQQFADWIKGRLEGFSESADFILHKTMKVQIEGGREVSRPITEYYLTIDTAKHLAMLERNENGKKIRAYFIEVEKAWNTPEMVFARALQAANKLVEESKHKIAELAPKAAFFDQVADSKTALQMRDVAAALNIPGWGRNKIFELLRAKGILDERNIPYRRYQDALYFRVIEQKYTDGDGETHINLKTLVYQRGVDFIRKTIESGK